MKFSLLIVAFAHAVSCGNIARSSTQLSPAGVTYVDGSFHAGLAAGPVGYSNSYVASPAVSVTAAPAVASTPVASVSVNTAPVASVSAPVTSLSFGASSGHAVSAAPTYAADVNTGSSAYGALSGIYAAPTYTSLSAAPVAASVAAPVAAVASGPVTSFSASPYASVGSVSAAPAYVSTTKYAAVPTVEHVPAVADIPVTRVDAQPAVIQKTVDFARPAVKTQRFEVRRPAIQKQFYDIEERVVIRPAGSAVVELDQPLSRTQKGPSVIQPTGGRVTVSSQSVTVPTGPITSVSGGSAGAVPSPLPSIEVGRNTVAPPAPPASAPAFSAPAFASPSLGVVSTPVQTVSAAAPVAAPVQSAPVQTVSLAAPVQSAPVQTVSLAAPVQSAPVQTVSLAAPVQSASVQSAPVQTVSLAAPVQSAPVQSAPVHTVSLAAPVQSASVQSAPVQTVSLAAPVQSAPVQTVSLAAPVRSAAYDGVSSVSVGTSGINSISAVPSSVAYTTASPQYHQQIVQTTPVPQLADNSVSVGSSGYNVQGASGLSIQGQNDFTGHQTVALSAPAATQTAGLTKAIFQSAPAQTYSTSFSSPVVVPSRDSFFRSALRVSAKPSVDLSYSSGVELSSPERYSSAIQSDASAQAQVNHENQQKLIQLLTAKGGVADVGFGRSGASSTFPISAGGVRARVLSATPAPAFAAPTGESVNTRRVVVSRPIETLQEVEVAEPVTKYERVQVSQPTVLKSTSQDVVRVPTSVPVYGKALAPIVESSYAALPSEWQ